MRKSLHILGDLYECKGDAGYFTNTARIRTKTLAMIRRAGFKIVTSRFHKFPATRKNEGGITGVIIVSESHLTIHTWPERRFVNLDVFFCNYSRDNTRKVRAVFKEFSNIYRPKRIKQREIRRD